MLQPIMISFWALFITAACSSTEKEYGSIPSEWANTAEDTASMYDYIAPDQTGPYEAGTRMIEFTDARGKELTMEIWYPATIKPTDELANYEPLVLTNGAYRNADLAVKERPLIAFSHGLFAVRFQSVYLTEHLAQQGYIVVAVDHPKDTIYDYDQDATAQVVWERPDDLRAAVDHALTLSEKVNHPLYQSIATDQYIVMGHSLGTLTALILSGAQLKTPEEIIEYCQTHPSNRICGYLDTIDELQHVPPPDSDPRVRDTVLMSPGLGYTLQTQSLQQLGSLLLLAGSEDKTLSYENEALPLYETLGEPKILATYWGAGHYGFSDICTLASFLSEECSSEATIYAPIERIQEQSKIMVSAYLGWSTYQDERFLPFLAASYWDADHVTIMQQ